MPSDSPHIVTLSPATAYVTKDNIAYPEYDPTHRTLQDERADARIEDVLPGSATVASLPTVPSA